MKKNHLPLKIGLLLILLFFLFSPWGMKPLPLAQEFPSPQGYVNDFAGIIEQTYQEKINALAQLLEDKTTAQIAVVTVETVAPDDYQSYANKLFEKWGIGKKGKDNGVLVFLTLEERKIWIEVGYGLEGALPDGLCGEILDKNIVPYLKQDKFGQGLYEGVKRIVGIVAQEYGVDLETGEKEPSVSPLSRFRPFLFFIPWIIALSFGLIPAFVHFRRLRCPKCGGKMRRQEKIIRPTGLLKPGLREIILVCSNCGFTSIQKRPFYPSGVILSGGSHRGSFGGFGGGFGGFGGGRSGGGGAGRGF